MARSSRKEMAALRALVVERAGGTCEWPGCVFPISPSHSLQVAHLHHRGMGGSPSTNRIDNVALLCRTHHDILDGRQYAGARFEKAVLLAAYLRLVYPAADHWNLDDPDELRAAILEARGDHGSWADVESIAALWEAAQIGEDTYGSA